MAPHARPDSLSKASALAVQKIPANLQLPLLELMLQARKGDENDEGLKRRGIGHFQMSGTGHEGLAGLGIQLRKDDYLHPHYRDRVLVMAKGLTHERCARLLLSKTGPGCQGRQMPSHYCAADLRIGSHSSPIGSKLLHAVGMAQSIKARGGSEIVVASLGDAGTREGETWEGLAQAAQDRLAVLTVIADNRYGISTHTEGKTFWTMEGSLAPLTAGQKAADCGGDGSFLSMPVYLADGRDVVEVYLKSAAALKYVRGGHGAAILIVKCERFGSHSSSDDQRQYRSADELARILERDPIPAYAEALIAAGRLTIGQYDDLQRKHHELAETAAQAVLAGEDPAPEMALNTALPPLPENLPEENGNRPGLQPKRRGGLTMAAALNVCLRQEMARNERVVIYGQDVEDPKGDVFGVTKGLSTQFQKRVTNAPLAEATIIGTAVGRSLVGDQPVAMIQFIDFIGPGMNQLLHELATMYWRSAGEWNAPVVVTAPCGGYLPGLGPWHSQSNEAIFAHWPGLNVVMPSTPADAVGLLRYALRCQQPTLFLYPKALLHSVRNAIAEPAADFGVPFGRARIVREGRDVTAVSWGNGVTLCEEAATNAAKNGVRVEIIDLRSIVPWDRQTILQSVHKTGRLIVVHEDGKTCGMAGEIIADLMPDLFGALKCAPARVTRSDDHIPYHYESELRVLPSAETVYATIVAQMSAVPVANVTSAAAAGFATMAAHSAQAGAFESETGEPMAASGGNGDGSAYAARSAHATHSGGGAQGVQAAGAPAGAAQCHEVVVPKQSPTDEDATVVKWHVKIGDPVTAGSKLVEMEANKGTYEIEAPVAGKVLSLRADPAQVVSVGQVLVTIETAAGAAGSGASHAGAGHGASGVAMQPPHTGPAAQAARIVGEKELSHAQMQVGALCKLSRTTIPQAAVAAEADVTKMLREHRKLKDRTDKPTVHHYLMWCLIKTLRNHREWYGELSGDGRKLLYRAGMSVGYASMSRSDDLFTPVVHDAEQYDFPALSKKLHELTGATREGRIRAEDVQGAAITLTNVGTLGVEDGWPFVIPGQVAMISAGFALPRMRRGESGQMEERYVLRLNMIFDHRPFNGNHASRFLLDFKTAIEALDVLALLAE
ncbi:MAG: 2-oxo acid dehydrogenase subunit E2 [Planctomycetota bacterium]